MSVNGLKVTDVIIFPCKNKEGNVRAFAKIVLNDQFIVSGVKVIESGSGLFVGFPQELSTDGNTYYDVCFPTTVELRRYISNIVLDQYSLTQSVSERRQA